MDAVWYLRKRYLITLLTFFGLICGMLMKQNMNIAIVELTTDKIVTIGNQTYTQAAEFKWTSVQKGFVLSMFFYGSLLSMFTGLMTPKYGGAAVFCLGTALTGVLSIISPFLLRLSIYVYSVTRVLEGIFLAFASASFIDVIAHWAPPNERTRLLSYAQLGKAVGSGSNFLVSAFLIHKFGWEAMFRITGVFTLLWCLVWFILVRNDPSSDKYVTKAERTYLTEITQMSKKKVPVPWKKMLISMPLWAYVNETFSKSWILSFTMTSLPLYIKDTNGGNIQEIGLISSIPAWCAFFSEIPVAYIVDYIRSKKIISIPNVHRICLAFGQVMVALLLIITGLWMNFSGSIITFSLIRICLAIASTSYTVLPVDLFPAYSSTARGISITGNSIGALLSTTLMGYMVSNHTRASWNRYFLLLSALNIWSFLIFLKFGSGKPQPWATGYTDEKAPEQEVKSDISLKITT